MMDREDDFEKLLSITPRIDDDGFTESLMLRLPPQRNIVRLRATVLLTFTLAASGIVAAIPGARQFLVTFVSGFASSSIIANLSLLTAGVLTALLIWGAISAATSEA